MRAWLYRHRIDGLIILIPLLLAAVILCVVHLNRKPGQTVVICHMEAGTEIELGRYDLKQNREIPVKTSDGYNFVVIRDGAVYVEDADCPNRLCVAQGKIAYGYQTIVCLPHGLIIRIEGGDSPDISLGRGAS